MNKYQGILELPIYFMDILMDSRMLKNNFNSNLPLQIFNKKITDKLRVELRIKTINK